MARNNSNLRTSEVQAPAKPAAEGGEVPAAESEMSASPTEPAVLPDVSDRYVPVPAGAKAAETAIVGELAHVEYFVRPNADSQDRYLIQSTLDFGDVSREQLIEIAARAIIVTQQRRWRELYEANSSEATSKRAWKRVNVLDDVINVSRGGSRGPVDPGKAALRSIAKMVSAGLLTEEEAEPMRAVLTKGAAA